MAGGGARTDITAGPRSGWSPEGGWAIDDWIAVAIRIAVLELHGSRLHRVLQRCARRALSGRGTRVVP